ncbi:hypothetical protein ROG8370_02694 [Roseovarius gaetbuli]|uniref:DarT domain-containing protein n=1 Tax=Roseovarius gaetbuli TaxID=1356575 RepID=A0A1X6ZR87_9RHOB|nr:DarT ssDNA thymidine ADP-ribosyltransferase family protein [Roseovarius gaetbuli]SLN58903.1 hypothetical protein ROG8370_02694 [Roseovarius gaetbuli]
MEILFYQCFIFTTLVLIRIFVKKYLEVACFIWTALTLINLFWPPLIVLQLIVVWGTYGLIAPKAPSMAPTKTSRSTVNQFHQKAKQGKHQSNDSARSSVTASARDVDKVEPFELKIGSPVSPDAGEAASSRLRFSGTPSHADKKLNKRSHDRGRLATKQEPRNTDGDLSIEGIVKSRRIEYLVHFTQAANLISIFREGLVSTDEAKLRGIHILKNDADRYDGYLNAISLSVSFPNAHMFYKLRKLRPETDWAILLIDPAVLYEKRCGFCRFNAADKRIPKRSEDVLVGALPFVGMFDRSIPSKDVELLRPCDPTDPQAEVLIFEPIELTRVLRVVFFDEKVLRCYEDVVQGVQKSVDRAFLDSRSFFLNSSVHDYKNPISKLSDEIPESEIPF